MHPVPTNISEADTEMRAGDEYREDRRKCLSSFLLAAVHYVMQSAKV